MSEVTLPAMPGNSAVSGNARQQPVRVLVEDFIRAASTVYRYTVDDLKGPSRRQPLVGWRQRAMYAARTHTAFSYPHIGRVFGGRDHTTVMYAVRKTARIIAMEGDDGATSREIKQISERALKIAAFAQSWRAPAPSSASAKSETLAP